MRVELRRVVFSLLAGSLVAAGLAACGPYRQISYDVTVSCGGAGCGKTGDLFVATAHTCTGGAAAFSGEVGQVLGAVTLSSSATTTAHFDYSSDSWQPTCAEAVLDVDGDGTFSPGDVFSSSGPGDLRSSHQTTLVLDQAL